MERDSIPSRKKEADMVIKGLSGGREGTCWSIAATESASFSFRR